MLGKIANFVYLVWKGFVALLAIQYSSHKPHYFLAEANNYENHLDDFTTDLNQPSPTHANTFSKLQESYPSRSLLEQLKNIPIFEEKIPKKVDPAPESIKKAIKKVLIKINNEETLFLILRNQVKIMIVSENKMTELTGAPMSACFMPTPYNTIVLNQHLFDNLQSKERLEQSITNLANELSHAAIHNNHPKKSEPVTDENNKYFYLVPWTSKKKERQFLEAYQNFNSTVNEYKNLFAESLSKPASMSKQKKDRLKKFDDALESYITPRYDFMGYNAMQSRLEEHNGQLTLLHDMSNTIPPKSKPAERLSYLRQNFFKELEAKGLTYKKLGENKIGIYSENKDQEIADLISDFESLSPLMRQTFGPELCRLLSEYFKTKDHCDRPKWEGPLI